MSSLRLITFDLDDTLWDVAPVMNNAEALLREWLASNAARLGPVPIEHLWAIRTRLLDREPMLRHRLSELRRRILLHALLDAGYPQAEAESLAEAGFQVFLEARHRVTLFPEVHPTLELLANRFTLGVLTNGNADVRRLGLADYFQFALCAEELGVGKPDPTPFREALKRAGVELGGAAHRRSSQRRHRRRPTRRHARDLVQPGRQALGRRGRAERGNPQPRRVARVAWPSAMKPGCVGARPGMRKRPEEAMLAASSVALGMASAGLDALCTA